MTAESKGLMESHRSDSEAALDWLLNGETAEEVRVVPEEDSGATPLYMLVLSVGWAERIIASRMYDHDAKGLAYAVAALTDCRVVLPS